MKFIILASLLFTLAYDSLGQLVTRKDYDAAFALQLGGEIGALTEWEQPKISLQPIAGLKMTFPFNRKWFLGSEVNYSRLKYGSQQFNFDIKQIHIPLYLKYMLNSNRASVLFGVYGCSIFESNNTYSLNEDNIAKVELLDDWSVGITAGYEYKLAKHFNAMFRLSVGVKELIKRNTFKDNKLLPIQASITLSYDIFRIGDCGCD